MSFIETENFVAGRTMETLAALIPKNKYISYLLQN